MAPSQRDYPDRPFVGVGVVIWRGDKVLLVKRGRPPRLDEWSIPGGAQMLGETVAEAARREVAEETGLSIELVGLIDVIDAIFPDDTGAIKHHYTLIDFAARWTGGDAIAADDITAVAWMGLDELDDVPLWSETRRIIRKSAALTSGAGVQPSS